MICGVVAHPKCLDNIISFCRPFSNTDLKRDFHWFIPKSEFKFSDTCIVCNGYCKSYHYICSWCGINVDCSCVNKLPKECHYSLMKKYILPPRLVVRKDNWYEAVYEEGREPLMFFINNKSGGHFGNDIYERAMNLVNPMQVYDVLKGYEKPLNLYTRRS